MPKSEDSLTSQIRKAKIVSKHIQTTEEWPGQKLAKGADRGAHFRNLLTITKNPESIGTMIQPKLLTPSGPYKALTTSSQKAETTTLEEGIPCFFSSSVLKSLTRSNDICRFEVSSLQKLHLQQSKISKDHVAEAHV